MGCKYSSSQDEPTLTRSVLDSVQADSVDARGLPCWGMDGTCSWAGPPGGTKRALYRVDWQTRVPGWKGHSGARTPWPLQSWLAGCVCRKGLDWKPGRPQPPTLPPVEVQVLSASPSVQHQLWGTGACKASQGHPGGQDRPAAAQQASVASGNVQSLP